jgi:hypothetical protein
MGGENNKKGPVGNIWEKVGTVGQVGTAPKPSVKYVGINETRTARVGEGHQHAKLTDAQVDQIRDEYEDGVEGRGPRIGYRALAKKWNVPKRTIRDIVNYNRRNHWPAHWKRV